MRTLIPALAVAAVLTGGCGDDESSDDANTAPGGKGSALELTLDPDGEGGEEPSTESVECPDPPRPGPDPLCGQVLLLSPKDFAPLPPDVACTEIYGGPDTLRVEGTLEGKPIEETFTREDGCEITRFDTWTPILKRLFPEYRPGESLAPG
jgi:hypothetical protein